MSWPNPAMRAGWFAQQFEASTRPDPTPEPPADDERPEPQEKP